MPRKEFFLAYFLCVCASVYVCVTGYGMKRKKVMGHGDIKLSFYIGIIFIIGNKINFLNNLFKSSENKKSE